MKPDHESLTVRLTTEQAREFKAVCDAHFRPVATEMRRLIVERIRQDAEERSAA